MGPLSAVPRKFLHRTNRDGSYDSICPLCVATVATSADEDGLLVHERKHVCDPQQVNLLKKLPKKSIQPLSKD